MSSLSDVAFIAQSPPVGWRDVIAILPALTLFLTGGVVLVYDLFLRGWSEPASPGEKSPLHFLSLLGTSVAAALVCAWLAKDEIDHGPYFAGAVMLDGFSLAVSLVILLGTLSALFASMDALRRQSLVHGEFHALVLFAAGAMILFAQANSLVLLFLSLETLSMAVFVLVAYTRDEKRSVEGALKYFLLGGFSSAFLLLGLVFLYGATGRMSLAEIAASLQAPGASIDLALLLAGLGLTVIGLAFKVGAFPFHSWLPDAYEGAPTVVTGFMAVTVKAASFAVLLRLGLLLVEAGASGSEEIRKLQDAGVAAISTLAVLTMIFGNVVALVQSSVKRMLAYSAIAHTGYLLVGIVAAFEARDRGPGSEAASAVLFYFLPYSLMTAGAFTVVSFLGRGTGDRESFADYRGLAKDWPWTSFWMLIFMLSFAGIPPSAGFWGKLSIFREAVRSGHWALALIGVITSIVSVYYYLRLVVNMYMHPADERSPAGGEEPQTTSGIVVGFAAVLVVLVGLAPELFLKLSRFALE
jgi:NADH-quinone oxidoreductase subunit N